MSRGNATTTASKINLMKATNCKLATACTFTRPLPFAPPLPSHVAMTTKKTHVHLQRLQIG